MMIWVGYLESLFFFMLHLTLFSKILDELYKFPSSADILPMKAFSVVSVHSAGRGCETSNMMKSQLVRIRDSGSGDGFYKLFITRQKQSGPRVKDGSFCLISGGIEVSVLDEYLACFPPCDDSRLWVYLSCSGDGNLSAKVNCPIGKNSLSKFGKQVAKLLGKRDWESFTGHCWRRTAATICADSGFSIPEIKNVTGHKSDTVVQGYVDSSMRMKRKASNALCVSSNDSARSAPAFEEASSFKLPLNW
jgi:hypothetical protein